MDTEHQASEADTIMADDEKFSEDGGFAKYGFEFAVDCGRSVEDGAGLIFR